MSMRLHNLAAEKKRPFAREKQLGQRPSCGERYAAKRLGIGFTVSWCPALRLVIEIDEPTYEPGSSRQMDDTLHRLGIRAVHIPYLTQYSNYLLALDTVQDAIAKQEQMLGLA